MTAFGLLLIAAVLAGGCGGQSTDAPNATATTGAPSSPGTTSAPAVTFASLPTGWRAFDGDGARLPRGRAADAAYATNWPFDPASGEGPAGALPARGAFVQVLLQRRAHARCMPGRGPTLPAHLAEMQRGRLEGAPRVQEYRYRAQLRDGSWIDVRLDLAPGTERSTAAAALRGVRVLERC